MSFKLVADKSDNLSYFCITNNNYLTKSHENVGPMLGFSKLYCSNFGLCAEFNFHLCILILWSVKN